LLAAPYPNRFVDGMKLMMQAFSVSVTAWK
jgi:hypothetical protein